MTNAEKYRHSRRTKKGGKKGGKGGTELFSTVTDESKDNPWSNDFNLVIMALAKGSGSIGDAVRQIQKMDQTEYFQRFVSPTQGKIDAAMTQLAGYNSLTTIVGALYHGAGHVAVNPGNRVSSAVGRGIAQLVTRDTTFAFTMGMSNGFYESLTDSGRLEGYTPGDQLSCIGGEARVTELGLEPADVRGRIDGHSRIFEAGHSLGRKVSSYLHKSYSKNCSPIQTLYGSG